MAWLPLGHISNMSSEFASGVDELNHLISIFCPNITFIIKRNGAHYPLCIFEVCVLVIFPGLVNK
jgi:hypothetical protein